MKKFINCDLGECLTPNPDAKIMPLIDMANIACGGHIGDNASMNTAILLAKKYGVQIGAHPSYEDKNNFGRISHSLSAKKLYLTIKNQVQNLQKQCDKNHIKLSYIKPHGGLYHDMMNNKTVFLTICEVLKDLDTDLFLVVAAGANNHLAIGENLQLKFEVFADRTYKNGKMLNRVFKNALLTNPKQIIQQYQDFSLDKFDFQIDTICFHSDNPASINALTTINAKH